MKKIILMIVLSLAITNIYAQHISFIGIQLGQSRAVVDKLLKQKGFKYTGELNGRAIWYEGAFWNYTSVSLEVRPYNGKITEILVKPSDKLYHSESDFNTLVRNLNKKYGKYKSIDDKYHDNLVSYNWTVKGGCVQATYFRYVSGEYLFDFTLRYIDSTSKDYVNLVGSKSRNRNNDL